MRRNKDLSSLFELQDPRLKAAASAAETFQPLDPEGPTIGVLTGPIARTTLPGGGQKGDTTVASFEYGDELEN